MLIAMNARTGRELWSFRQAGAIESSPLIVDGTIYLRLVGPLRLCDRRPDEEGQVALSNGRPGRRRSRVLPRHDLHPDEQRPPLCDQRVDGPGALARFVVLALRAARVLLCNAHRCLRPRLHRQRRRLRLLVRSEDRPPDLGSARRDVRLHGCCGVAEDGVRRDVGRLGRRVRRGDRQDALAARLARRCVRGADGDERAALLLDARGVRGQTPAARRARRQPDLRPRRPDREAHLELRGRRVFAHRRGPGAGLSRRPDTRLRPRGEEAAKTAKR